MARPGRFINANYERITVAFTSAEYDALIAKKPQNMPEATFVRQAAFERLGIDPKTVNQSVQAT